MIAGYYVALERTLFYDHVDDESLRLWEINVKVHEEGMKLIKPGVACKDIALELNKIFEEYGLLESRTFGYGHSFGVLSHYYGREAGAGGYREHDVMVITKDSAYDITKFPYGPEHNIITN
jgi:creatinase